MTVKKKFKIDGMHCTSCAMSIDMDLEDLDGVKQARTSYAKEELEIEYEEGKLDVAKIVLSISKTGYRAQVKSE